MGVPALLAGLAPFIVEAVMPTWRSGFGWAFGGGGGCMLPPVGDTLVAGDWALELFWREGGPWVVVVIAVGARRCAW